MLYIDLEEHTNHAKVIKDRYLDIDQPDAIKSIYLMGCLPNDEERDYRHDSNEVLKYFLTRLNRFPLFVTFGGGFTNEEVEPFFQKENLCYTKVQPDKSSPFYSLQVNDASELERLLDETYWYAAVNDFYFISFTNLLTFERKMVKGWFFKKERIVPVIRATIEMSFITMEHDFMGYYLFSNEACFDSEDKVKAFLPKGEGIDYYD
ncbi:hypothetical protein [Exiguobacterium sp. MH3]|uniref:hypothetical protein n=1 Tax=Exiguobacterium sp. MH3 TaxID=1399115 RepID=UPI0003C3AE39|nr:hypothetical protein [Exiguobacterium sp. MH3]AHA31345.1 hypothetical protein U719_07210 [Exiguobacterium sp. MH3]